MAILFKNADVYAPEHLGRCDILTAAGKILAVAPDLNVALPDLETVDASGLTAVPGFIDQHIHVLGGGGEGGPKTRVPEVMLSELIRTGTTSLVGLLGTDNMTRSVEALVAKVRGLTAEGVTAWMYTSTYAFPPQTLTGDVRRDLLAIPECLGVKIALADHRCSFPSQADVMHLLSDIRVGGMISGKLGVLHIHMGALEDGISLLLECVRRGMPIQHMRPTHCTRNAKLMAESIEFARQGGWIDYTASDVRRRGHTADCVVETLKAGVDPTHLTLSSDGHGSMPKFNAKGEMVGLGVGVLSDPFAEMRLVAERLGLETALRLVTSNVADALEMTGKGHLCKGRDADINFLDSNLDLVHVVAKGRVMMRSGEVLARGTFED